LLSIMVFAAQSTPPPANNAAGCRCIPIQQLGEVEINWLLRMRRVSLNNSPPVLWPPFN
jgi:hypothetical protein